MQKFNSATKIGGSLLTLVILAVVIYLLLPTSPKEASASAVATPTKLSAEEGLAFMQETEDFVLLDVRSLEEYTARHLPQAVSFPLDLIDDEHTEVLLPELDQIIIVYCQSGRRSQMAANMLVELGYTRVYDIGGIVDWPYETVRG